MSRRLLKMYIRDENKVFRAVEGLEFGENITIIDKSVYTIASTSDVDFIILNKKR